MGETAEEAIKFLKENKVSARWNVLKPTEEMWGWDFKKRAYVSPNGDCFSSKRQMAYCYGTDYSAVRYRLMQGATLEQALTPDPSPFDIMVNGNLSSQSIYGRNEDGTYHVMKEGKDNYETIKEMVKSIGMPLTFYRKLCLYDIDVEEWIKNHDPEFPTKDSPLVIEGELFTNPNQAAKARGTNAHVVFTKMIKENKSFGVALLETKPSVSRKDDELIKAFGYDAASGMFIDPNTGEHYKTKKALCDRYGIASSTVRRRLLQGIALEDALTITNARQVKHA